eukprot:TRINITY_DN11614_c0_g1_i1.p1 TRINITY_DN11614_c0_g1~~TRINITY_DN11614_c0_g1_i1.p1  ORF type:complete len:180 (+),score=30.55 TRINITY_DN11614_c0_g1_i1:389-928(+)
MQVDLSYMYHNIKTQSTVKLYVIVNMLEILDRLASSMGQDVFHSLGNAVHSPAMSVLDVALLSMGGLLYLALHIFIILCQVLSLTVALNAHDASLLAILLSNQFIELKGTVFKRCDATGLMQFMCYDMRERFQHVCVLLMIVVSLTCVEDRYGHGTILSHAWLRQWNKRHLNNVTTKPV